MTPIVSMPRLPAAPSLDNQPDRTHPGSAPTTWAAADARAKAKKWCHRRERSCLPLGTDLFRRRQEIVPRLPSLLEDRSPASGAREGMVVLPEGET